MVRSKSLAYLNNNNNTVSSPEILSKFTKDMNQNLDIIMDIFNAQNLKDEPKPFVYAFVDNSLRNVNRSKHQYEYNPFVQKFALAFHVLAGTNVYEYLGINLSGAFPTITTLEKYN